MFHSKRLPNLLLMVLFLAGWQLAPSRPTCGQTASDPVQPWPGAVLLRNGQVIEGTITQTADGYRVALAHGEVQLKKLDVESIGSDLGQLYAAKRATIAPDDVSERLRLVQWAIRLGLYDEAGRELAAVGAIEPNQPILDALRRRLEAQKTQSQQARTGSTGGPAAVTGDDLERMVRALPPGTIEAFTQRVQPMLVNNCTAAGCHGAQSETTFKLLKLPPGQPPSRRLTQRNLHSTMQWVDRQDPSASRLLAKALEAHGGARASVFLDPQSPQYRRLAEWTHQAAGRLDVQTAGRGAASKGLAAGKGLPHTPPNGLVPDQAGPAGSRPPAAFDPQADGQPTAATAPPAAVFQMDAPLPPARSAPKRGGTLPSAFSPRDPFDPEIFNRRHAPAPAERRE